jgi:hypothetical protein
MVVFSVIISVALLLAVLYRLPVDKYSLSFFTYLWNNTSEIVVVTVFKKQTPEFLSISQSNHHYSKPRVINFFSNNLNKSIFINNLN